MSKIAWSDPVITVIMNKIAFFIKDPYSFRSESAGFAKAALIDWKLTVNRAINKEINPAERKIKILRPILNGKFTSQ